MFIWRGAGILVPVIAFVCSLLAELITRDLSGGKEYWDTHSTPFSLAMLVAGGLIWAMDSYLYRNPGRLPEVCSVHRRRSNNNLWLNWPLPGGGRPWLPLICGLLAALTTGAIAESW